MKKNIHPVLKPGIIRCACGAEHPLASTGSGLSVEKCARCHPFYTGQKGSVRAEGRIRRFEKRYAAPAKGARP